MLTVSSVPEMTPLLLSAEVLLLPKVSVVPAARVILPAFVKVVGSI